MTMLHKNNIDHINVPNNMKKGWNYDNIFGHDVNLIRVFQNCQ